MHATECVVVPGSVASPPPPQLQGRDAREAGRRVPHALTVRRTRTQQRHIYMRALPPLIAGSRLAARRPPQQALRCTGCKQRWLFVSAVAAASHLALSHDFVDSPAGTNTGRAWLDAGSVDANSVFVETDPPIEVGRSIGSDDDLFEPTFLELGNGAAGGSPRLLVAAGSPSDNGSVSRIFMGSDNATSWTEATFSRSSTLGICLPATDNGTLCLPRGSVLERDCSVSAGNVYAMQSILITPGSNTTIVQHTPLRVDMSNASFNMSFVVDPVSHKATNISTFHALGTVAPAGNHLFLLLTGHFDVPANVLPSGCTPKAPVHGRPGSLSASLVLISSIDMGLNWVYRSSVPLQSTVATTSLAQEDREDPVCSPACPKGTVCASGTDPHQCVRSVCKPKCKDCEICDDGVCVPGEVRYVTAYPPVLVGEGTINGSDGEKLWKPQLRALTGRVGSGPLNSTILIIEARTGGDANSSRFLSSADGNGKLWSEALWNQSQLSDGQPGASPVCFPWGSVGQILCSGRQLHRNTSFVPKNSSASACLREERTGYAHAGSFQMDTSDSSTKGTPRNIQILSADNISLNLSIVHNITAGVRQLIGGRPVQLFDAQMMGSPATIDGNGTLIQLLSVAWDVHLDTCLHTQNKLCLADRKEEQLIPAKAGKCAMCLAEHMTELVGAGCNDSDSSLFCSTPGPTYPGKSSITAVISTDSGQTWDFRAHIPRWRGYNASAPNDGWPLGMNADPYAAWTCGLRALSADVTAVHQPATDNEHALLFAVWQPQELDRSPDPGSRSTQAPTCGARSLDGGATWTALDQLHARRASPDDGSNQEAPPFPAGGPIRLSTLGALGGVAISDGNCGEGRAASGKPGAGLWLWSASVLGLNATQNATPSLQATNLALLHNANVKPSKTNELRFTSQFVNGTDHAAQSSGETDIRLLRSNKTHAELLVVYDRLPNTPDKSGTRLWNGTKTQVWAMRLVVASMQPSVLPCAPKCKAKEICVHNDPPQPWGQQGKCVTEKSCTKPKCKAPETCDKQSGRCVTPPPPPPQSCLEPESADIATVTSSTTTSSTTLVAVWQPHRPGRPYKGSICRATSHDAGRSWQFHGTINEGKDVFLSTVHSYGISPRLAYAPTSPSSGFALVTQGRSSALGAGLSIWVTRVSIGDSTSTTRGRGSESTADNVPVMSFSDKWFNLAALHNDALASIVDTERSFTNGFVSGEVDPAEAGSGTGLHVLSSNSTHAELVVLYSKRKGLFLPDWYKHIGFPTKVQQNETILFSMRIRVSTLQPPAQDNKSQLEYITWYDSYPEEQLELTKPGPNLIWASGDPAALDAKARSLGVSAMWAFNEYCAAEYRIFDAPYCGDDRVYCNPNITDSCPFGKACPQPPDEQCKIPPKKNQPHWLCECPYPAAQLALNWTQHVHAVAALLQNKTSIVGLWMGDEPEIGGMASDSLCAVAAAMKQALYRVGRSDVWIMYNDGPESARFSEGLCKGLDYFSIDSYDTGAAEANEVAGLYKRALVPKLRGPNKWEPRGQGLWFVPGLYAPCTGPVVPTPRYPFGNQSLNRSEPTCKGGRLSKTPSDIMAKMKAFWKYAKEMPHIKGLNPWHWQDRPTMQPDTFRRGAKSLGPELLALMTDISKSIHNASSTQVQGKL